MQNESDFALQKSFKVSQNSAIPAGSQFVESELVRNNTFVDSKATNGSAASEMLGLPSTNLPMEGPNGPSTAVPPENWTVE